MTGKQEHGFLRFDGTVLCPWRDSALEQDTCSQSSEMNTAKIRYTFYLLLLKSALFKSPGPTASWGLKAVLCCSQLSFDIYCFSC